MRGTVVGGVGARIMRIDEKYPPVFKPDEIAFAVARIVFAARQFKHALGNVHRLGVARTQRGRQQNAGCNHISSSPKMHFDILLAHPRGLSA